MPVPTDITTNHYNQITDVVNALDEQIENLLDVRNRHWDALEALYPLGTHSARQSRLELVPEKRRR